MDITSSDSLEYFPCSAKTLALVRNLVINNKMPGEEITVDYHIRDIHLANMPLNHANQSQKSSETHLVKICEEST